MCISNAILCFVQKCTFYCRFSLSHHHPNHSTNKVKNQRDKRRWMFKQSWKDSSLCNVSCRRNSKKCFTQIFKALYGDAVFVSLWGAQIWHPKTHVIEFCCKKPVIISWGLINIYASSYFHSKTVQIAKSQ